jgi:cyclopropane fatty-acyl-phospholipid synthase-like methyltransferase
LSQHSGRDRDRFSLIGHAALPFMCPLEERELCALLDAAAPPRGSATLDLGGGRADLSVLLARRHGVRPTSVDRSAQATEAAHARIAGLDVTLVTTDAATHLASVAPRSLSLASCVGAVHCFGVGAPAWHRAAEALDPLAERLLLGDLVATTREAAEAFELAELRELDTLAAHVHRTVITSQLLDASRVRAYERAWCASLAAHVEAHPGDPRNAWARARLTWAEDPSLEAAREALRFAVFVL